jgi:low affinity Fe/Cu permease
MTLRPAVRKSQASAGASFDRFAEASADFASRGAFFAACLLIVVVWAPSYFLVRDVNTRELVINTITTTVTFLLVALLQNSARRSEQDGAVEALGRGEVRDGDSNVVKHPAEATVAGMLESSSRRYASGARSNRSTAASGALEAEADRLPRLKFCSSSQASPSPRHDCCIRLNVIAPARPLGDYRVS